MSIEHSSGNDPEVTHEIQEQPRIDSISPSSSEAISKMYAEIAHAHDAENQELTLEQSRINEELAQIRARYDKEKWGSDEYMELFDREMKLNKRNRDIFDRLYENNLDSRKAILQKLNERHKEIYG